MSQVQTYDPRTGERRDAGLTETTASEVASVCAHAADAAMPFGHLGTWPLTRRSGALRAVADRIEAEAADLAALADEETALGLPRLHSEIVRTVGQLRLFAAAVEEGSFLDVIVDPADPDAQPIPRPDLRRMLQPIGPVAVFAASNFPFAFSVAGGDTAAALAAGCPVVVKAHEGHPRTSARTAQLVTAMLSEAGAPPGTFAIVYGRDAGLALVAHPHVRAVGFTGSVRGGRALFDVAVARPDPIPFYGELGSLNPVVVTPAAVAARGAEIAAGFVASFTLGTGQFCTKPGLLFLPAGHGLDEALAEAVATVPAGPLLTHAIRDGFAGSVERLEDVTAVRLIAGTKDVALDDLRQPGVASDEPSGRATPRAGGQGSPLVVSPRLYGTAAASLVANPALAEECFGPAALVVEWEGEDDLFAALDQVAGSLTATVHAEDEDEDRGLSERLLARARNLAGRIIWNGWPTGVPVTEAMHHGGPWPATTSPLHTSVGTTSIRRFLVPVVYQDTPQHLLPAPLRD
ncbi:MAG: aldehyde dehydrogenase (NADP(+)) [Acidimicrobiales bacterium]